MPYNWIKSGAYFLSIKVISHRKAPCWYGFRAINADDDEALKIILRKLVSFILFELWFLTGLWRPTRQALSIHPHPLRLIQQPPCLTLHWHTTHLKKYNTSIHQTNTYLHFSLTFIHFKHLHDISLPVDLASVCVVTEFQMWRLTLLHIGRPAMLRRSFH